MILTIAICLYKRHQNADKPPEVPDMSNMVMDSYEEFAAVQDAEMQIFDQHNL